MKNAAPELLGDIENYLYQYIKEKNLRQGDKLPSERDIVRRFNTNNLQVRRALQLFEEQDILVRVPKKGMFVKNPKDTGHPIRTNKIGVLYWPKEEFFFKSEFYSRILAGINTRANQDDKYILLHSLRKYEHTDPVQVFYKMEDEVDGFIITGLIPSLYKKIQGALQALSKPVVVLIYKDILTGVDSVVMDNIQDTRQIMQFLVDSGHRNIGCLYYHSIFDGIVSTNIQERIDTYKQVLDRNGIALREDLMLCREENLSLSEESPLFIQFKELMRSSAAPTAFYCVDDDQALVVYRMCRLLNIRIPEDLTVVGMTDLEKAAALDPPLTTVRAPLEEIGEKGVQLIYEKLEKRQTGITVGQKVILSGELVIRSSHKKLN